MHVVHDSKSGKDTINTVELSKRTRKLAIAVLKFISILSFTLTIKVARSSV